MGKLINKNRKIKRKIRDLVSKAATGGSTAAGVGTPSENPEATLPQAAQQAQVQESQGTAAGAPEQTGAVEDSRKRRKQKMSNVLGIQV